MINDTLLEQKIVDLIKNNDAKDSDEAIQKFASELSKAICETIKSAKVTVFPGIPVQVTPASGTGSTISNGEGSLS